MKNVMSVKVFDGECKQIRVGKRRGELKVALVSSFVERDGFRRSIGESDGDPTSSFREN